MQKQLFSLILIEMAGTLSEPRSVRRNGITIAILQPGKNKYSKLQGHWQPFSIISCLY